MATAPGVCGLVKLRHFSHHCICTPRARVREHVEGVSDSAAAAERRRTTFIYGDRATECVTECRLPMDIYFPGIIFRLQL